MRSWTAKFFFALVLVACGLPPARAQVVPEDSLALVAFYEATGGSNWIRHDNWLTGPVSGWYGITVAEGRVTEMNLISNGLTGSLPPILGDLSALERLFLDDNALTGPMPPELQALTRLSYLLIESNDLSGNIPAWLGDLSALTRLRLGSNQLSGAIPPELQKLDNLFVLTLDDNDLTGEIPPELGNLESLVDLFLSHNRLTGPIPPNLGRLAHLMDFRLSSNELSGEIPPELGGLTGLAWLYLDDNRLAGPIPSELGNLEILEELAVNDNLLSGSLPLNLSNLSLLSSFHFDNTSLCEPLDENFQSWLQGIDDVQSTGCTNVGTENPDEVPALRGASYPNPFSTRTTIAYELVEAARACVSVYDALGRRVRVLVDEVQPTGVHEVVFDGTGFPGGVYLYLVEAGDLEAGGMIYLVR